MGTDDSKHGKTPAQWFVRLMGLAIVGGGLAAVVASWNDITRYAHIKQM